MSEVSRATMKFNQARLEYLSARMEADMAIRALMLAPRV